MQNATMNARLPLDSKLRIQTFYYKFSFYLNLMKKKIIIIIIINLSGSALQV